MILAERLGLPRPGARFRLEADTPGVSRIIVARHGGEVVGAIDATTGEDGASLLVSSLCIEDGRRGYGAGSEAARLLIRAAEESGFSCIRAWAPAGRGLAVYFWMRMGLRPLHGEGPDGGIWLERSTRR